MTDLTDLEVERLRAELAEARDPHRPYRPFGKLDPDNPVDQAFVRAFNRGARKAEPRCRICGYDEHAAHHLSTVVKGYHPFVPATDTVEEAMDAPSPGEWSDLSNSELLAKLAQRGKGGAVGRMLVRHRDWPDVAASINRTLTGTPPVTGKQT